MNEKAVVEDEAQGEGPRHSSKRGRAPWPISVHPPPGQGACLQKPALMQEGLWGSCVPLCLLCKWDIRSTSPEGHKQPVLGGHRSELQVDSSLWSGPKLGGRLQGIAVVMECTYSHLHWIWV